MRRIKITDHPKVGVLGGGQLARMLALSAHQMGLEPHVLSMSPNDPAAQVTSHHHRGDPNQPGDVALFLGQVEVATFESEFLTLAPHPKLRPSAPLMAQLQDRLSQKESLVQAHLPTLPFRQLDKPSDAMTLFSIWSDGFVLKQRMYGYDGYGTFFMRSPGDLKPLLTKLGHPEYGYIAEPLLNFRREMAISLARSADGSFATFPLVETRQVNGRCFWVKGPMHHSRQKSLTQRLKKYLSSLRYVGIMAFELFDTGDDLLINEIAPRVHNSAHHSLDSLSIDQFTLHWMAVLGKKIADPKPNADGFAMVNLLGKSKRKPRLQFSPQGHLHWYGKEDNRSGRKMGHLNITGSSPDVCLRQGLQWERQIKL